MLKGWINFGFNFPAGRLEVLVVRLTSAVKILGRDLTVQPVSYTHLDVYKRQH